MSKKTNWEKRRRENEERMQRHEAERSRAAAAAAKQHKPVDGLHSVELPSIAEQLDEVDPHVRAALRTTPAEDLFKTRHRTELEDRATEPIAAPYRKPNGEFVPPRTNPFEIHREESDMPYTSPHTAFVRKIGGKKAPVLAIGVPKDIVDALGFELLAGMKFTVQMSEDGLLFQPGAATARAIPKPGWAVKK